MSYITDKQVGEAVRSPAVVFNLGRIVQAEITGTVLSPSIAAEGLIGFTASALTDTSEHDRPRRYDYIEGKLNDAIDFDAIIEPVRAPDDFDGESLSEKAIGNYERLVADAHILDYPEWLIEQSELARDAAVQSKIDQARGK
jgi:hypothetical protein